MTDPFLLLPGRVQKALLWFSVCFTAPGATSSPTVTSAASPRDPCDSSAPESPPRTNVRHSPDRSFVLNPNLILSFVFFFYCSFYGGNLLRVQVSSPVSLSPIQEGKTPSNHRSEHLWN